MAAGVARKFPEMEIEMEMEMGPEDVEKGRKTALALRAKDLLVGYSTNHICQGTDHRAHRARHKYCSMEAR